MHPVGLFLAFDFGTKNIGLAVGQTFTKTASPLTTLNYKNGKIPWDTFQKIIKEWQPVGFIVGLSLQLDNSPTPISDAAMHFGYDLQKRFSIPVFFIEERLTSVAAHSILRNTPKDIYSNHSQPDKDSMAAAIILESWFNQAQEKVHV